MMGLNEIISRMYNEECGQCLKKMAANEVLDDVSDYVLHALSLSSKTPDEYKERIRTELIAREIEGTHVKRNIVTMLQDVVARATSGYIHDDLKSAANHVAM